RDAGLFLLGEKMSESSLRQPIRPTSSRREVADHINRAFKTSDITEICQAIGAAICQYNISDISKRIRDWKADCLSRLYTRSKASKS
ncbi:MAG: hypothetical protein ACJ8EL_03590, partial [Rhizomicrobium sp.]